MKVTFLYFLLFVSTFNVASFDENINKIKLPELGDRVSGAVSSAQEKAIGERFLQQVYSQAPIISDPLIFDYTEYLIYRLSEYSQVKERSFTLLLIDDSSLNAFAALSLIHI